MATIAVLGTYDSKGVEHGFIAEVIRSKGFETLLVNVGCLEEPAITVDISSAEVAAAGGDEWREVLAEKDRGKSVSWMAQAAAKYLAKLVGEGRIDGVISLGGGGGTAIATAAMRALPLGLPKVMVSTLASGNVAPYVGVSDIVMIPAIVDVAGVNRISRTIFENAAGAICGMVDAAVARKGRVTEDKPLVVASMFGNTTDCVNEAKRILESAGYEVLVFHATGQGGRAMESLIASGMVTGVLDVTTTEWADELVGGILGAGPTRLEAAGKAGVPAVVAPGCLDMVNFGEPATVPEKFAGRTFYHHNPQVTLMRTTPEECNELGRIIAGKVNAYQAPVTVLIPRKGVSVISAPGQPFHDETADAALFGALRENLREGVAVKEWDGVVNDAEFARMCAEALLENMKGR